MERSTDDATGGGAPTPPSTDESSTLPTLYLCRQGPRWVVVIESPRITAAVPLHHAGRDTYDAQFELLASARRACPDAAIMSTDRGLTSADYEWRVEVRGHPDAAGRPRHGLALRALHGANARREDATPDSWPPLPLGSQLVLLGPASNILTFLTSIANMATATDTYPIDGLRHLPSCSSTDVGPSMREADTLVEERPSPLGSTDRARTPGAMAGRWLHRIDKIADLVRAGKDGHLRASGAPVHLGSFARRDGQHLLRRSGEKRNGELEGILLWSAGPGSFITVNKPPVSLWIMELSGRAFGFSSWSMLLPEAVAGLVSVMVLYNLVRRWFGEPAAAFARWPSHSPRSP